MATYEFGVQMSCSGCSGAVTKAISKLDGVKSSNVSLEDQKVLVDADPSLSFDTVQSAIAKTGKKVTYAKTVD